MIKVIHIPLDIKDDGKKENIFPKIFIIENEILKSRNKKLVFPFFRVLRKLLVC